MFKHVLITAAIAGLIAVALPVEASAARVATASGQMTCKQAVSQRACDAQSFQERMQTGLQSQQSPCSYLDRISRAPGLDRPSGQYEALPCVARLLTTGVTTV